MIIIKYETEEESHQIILDKTALGFTLIEVSNITEGNFLGFLEPNEIRTLPPVDQLQVLQDKVDLMQSALDDLILAGGAL